MADEFGDTRTVTYRLRRTIGQPALQYATRRLHLRSTQEKTVEIIHKAEHYRRGFYTGVMGYFDGSNFDSAVMIRFLEQEDNGSMVFKSGGGITFQSDAASEYKEMKQKIYVPIYRDYLH